MPAQRAADLLFAVRAQDAFVFGEHENRQLQTSADPAPKVAGSSPVAPAINAVRRIKYRILK